jgi:hypothetical protein
MIKRDLLTQDLFEIPQAASGIGGLACRAEIASLMSDVLKGHDRYLVAAAMSKLLDRDISKHMLDAYTAESREDHIPPFDTAMAFDMATNGFSLINLYAKKLGAKVVVGREAIDAEIGKLERIKQEASDRIKSLKGLNKHD